MSTLKYRRKASRVLKDRVKRSSNKKPKASRGQNFLRKDQTQVMYKAIEAGMPPRKAADLAGIDKRTFDEWMGRGRKKDPRYSRKCYNFRKKVLQLEKQRELAALEAVKKMGEGGLEITEKKIKMVGENETEITVTTKTLAPKWQAAAWYLERRCEDYTNTIVDNKPPEEKAREISTLIQQMSKTIPSNPQ